MKYCPNQECPHLLSTGSAPEYLDDIQNCANCSTELLNGEAVVAAEQEEIVPDSPLVIIATFGDVQSAYLAKSLIESTGIPVFLRDEHLVSIQPFYALAVGGVKLAVAASQAETALKFLQSEQAEAPLPPEQDDDEPEFTESEERFPEQCPRCKSDRITPVNPSLKSGLISLLLAIPLRLRGKKYKCQTCGYKWK
ncbi:MAG: DUF2007 domain-containing protein [Thermodesulfobacteriota bacterium]